MLEQRIGDRGLVMDWSPFRISDEPVKIGPLATREGVIDRLRVAAFAELQAREAFRWAAAHFPESPRRTLWLSIADEEDRHYGMIMTRMRELGGDPADKPVSNRLWRSLQGAQTPEEFSAFMTRAEERGRAAERRFHEVLAASDPATAEMFRSIADDEDRHIASQALPIAPR